MSAAESTVPVAAPGDALGAAVVAAMRAIYDPCSVAADTPVSLYDMGLLQGWEHHADGRLEVKLTVTFGACTMAPHFSRALEEQLGALPGVSSVMVTIDASGLWTTDRMTEHGRALLAARPVRFTERDRPRPRQWMESSATTA